MSYSSMLTAKITVAVATGKDSYGDPSFGIQRVVSARVENSSNTITDASGRERISNTQIATTERLGLKDQIWLPGTDTTNVSEARRPMRIDSASTPHGSFTVFMTYL